MSSLIKTFNLKILKRPNSLTDNLLLYRGKSNPGHFVGL